MEAEDDGGCAVGVDKGGGADDTAGGGNDGALLGLSGQPPGLFKDT